MGGGFTDREAKTCGDVVGVCMHVCGVTHSIMDAGMEQQSWIAVSGEVRWAVYEASTTCLFLFTTSR